MTEQDMQYILAGLPVQIPGQPNPALNREPSFPPLTQAEINQIMANVQMPPPISQDEINRIFESNPTQDSTTGAMGQTFEGIPQQTDIPGSSNPLPYGNLSQF